MRIWVMTQEYSSHIIGGLGVVATRLSKCLGDIPGMDVVVLTTGKKCSSSIWANPGVIHIPRLWLKEPQKVWEKLKRAGVPLPHLIHIHSVQYCPLAAFFKKLKVPLLYTCHSLICLETAKKRSAMEKEQVRLLNLATKVVVPSNWMKNEITKVYPHIAKKTTVIQNGVSPFPEKRSSPPLYKLAFIGRILPSKGIRKLIEALPMLINTNPQVTLDIYGGGTTKYVDRLKTVVKDLQLESKVFWHGFMEHDQLREILPTLGAVVMPSKGESFGLVALETLASGVPLVSTCVGGMNEFLSSGVAEIIHEVNPTSIASAICRMWSQPDVTNLRVENGLLLASHYTWESKAKEYREIMEGMK
jgi:glycogen(starch) synthase